MPRAAGEAIFTADAGDIVSGRPKVATRVAMRRIEG
jgi:hypothetical protein